MARKLAQSNKIVNGRKGCVGPTHPRMVYLPVNDFYVRLSGPRTGELLPWCKKCHKYRRDNPISKPGRAFVPKEQFMPIREELIRRIGITEAARRMGFSYNQMSDSYMAKKKSVRATTFSAAVKVLAKAREKGEDGWDMIAARVAGSNPVLAGQMSWSPEARIRRQEKIDAMLKKSAAGINPWAKMEQHYASLNTVDETPPDSYWWIPDQNSYIPRFGEEMLGSDF